MDNSLEKFYRNEEAVSNLETLLQSSLNPVIPRTEFVTKLQRRLVAPSVVILENRSVQKAYVVLAIGLFLGMLFFWIVRLLRPKTI